MTDERKEQFKSELLAAMPGIKKNPNNYPIVDKWNNRIFRKNKFAAFHIIEQAVEEQIHEMFQNELQDMLDRMK